MPQPLDPVLLSDLRYLADCEARNLHPAANHVVPCMEAGLVDAWHFEWGHYRVQLTDRGRAALKESGSDG